MYEYILDRCEDEITDMIDTDYDGKDPHIPEKEFWIEMGADIEKAKRVIAKYHRVNDPKFLLKVFRRKLNGRGKKLLRIRRK